MAWKVDWRVVVDGRDMSGGMRPYLMGLTVSDKDGTAGDTCSLDFDDSGGQISLPPEGAKVAVFLDGAMVFNGTVDAPARFSLSRGGGRTLTVSAKGFDSKGKVKEPQSHHMDDATLQQFLDKAARKAGLSGIQIDPAFASIKRDYWSADTESFLHIGQKLARELNATFKIRGDKAVLAQRGLGANAGGNALPTIIGEVGRNVITCNIMPVTTRKRFATTAVKYFDRPSASFKIVETGTGLDGEAVNEVRAAAADEEQAKGIGEGRKTEGQREGGEGSVELDLAPGAQAEGSFVLIGARPGVDGTYRIVSVTHKADRGGGSTTSLELKQPGGGAGKDDRKAQPAGSSPDTSDFALPIHETLG